MGIVRKRQKNHKKTSKEDTPSRAPEWINDTSLEPRRGKRFIDVLLASGIQTPQSRISHLTIFLFLVGFITAVAFGYEWSVAIPIALILGLHKFLLLIQTKQNLDQLIEGN